MFGNLVLVLLCVSFVFIAPARFDWDQLFCLCAFMGLVAVSFNVKPIRQVKLGFLSLLIILALITLGMSFFYFKLKVIMYCFIGIMAIKAMAERLEDNFIRKLGWFLAAFCGASVIYVWMQHNGLDPIYQATFQDEGGSFARPWALGCFAVMAMPFIWNVNKWITVLPAILVYNSHSVLCIFAAFVVLLLLLPKKYCVTGLLLMIVCVGSYIGYEGGLESHRIQVWKGVWPYAMETPWLGHGVGSFLHRGFAHFVGKNDTNFQHQPWLHNEFYQYFYAQGAIGLGVLLAWVASMLFIKNKIIRAALIGMCILCCFHIVMHWGRLIFFGCIILTLGEIEKYYHRRGIYGR